MEAKYKKFLEFSWRDSEDWQLYYSNLSDIPQPKQVEHFKKRFYKLKIDNDFDVKWVPPAPQAETNNRTSYPTNNLVNNRSINSPFLAATESLLWVVFLISNIIIPVHTLKLVGVCLLIRVIRRTGRPQLNMEYAQSIFLDEHFQLILYALLLFIDRFNYFTMVPLYLTAVLNLCEYIKGNPTRFGIVMPYVNKIYNKRVELALMRANVEVAIGFLLVFGIFVGLNSFISPIFFWQYLRFKYIVNNDIKHSFGKLNGLINGVKNKPSVPGAIKYVLTKIQWFAEYMGRTEAAPGAPGQAAGSNCNIF